MKTIALFNNKGGVGKTTLTCNIAAALARDHGLRVLVADLDPQSNSTQYMLRDHAMDRIDTSDRSQTIFNIIRPTIEDARMPYAWKPRFVRHFGCSLLPGDWRLSTLRGPLERDWHDLTVNERAPTPLRAIRSTMAVCEALRRHAPDHDIALIDLGPSLDALNRSALLAADHVVAPVSMDYYSSRAITTCHREMAQWAEKWKTAFARAERDHIEAPAFATFGGVIINNFAIRNGKPVSEHEQMVATIAQEAAGLYGGAPMDHILGLIKNAGMAAQKAQRMHRPMPDPAREGFVKVAGRLMAMAGIAPMAVAAE